MGKEIRHYVVKRKTRRAFWQPTKKMRRLGFSSVPLGLDGPDAVKLAEEWNLRWDRARSGVTLAPALADAANLSPDRAEALTIYPPRSLGAAFREYRLTHEWARKAPRTREEWYRAWRWIKPVFGDTDPRTVRLSTISDWRQAIADSVSVGEAHRSLKIWRALWKVAAALHYCARDADPSLSVVNTAPQGRSQTWSEGEAARLAKQAWRMGFCGLAAVIAVSWDTQLAPQDVRDLRASQMATAGAGQVFFTERGKTGKPVGGLLSARTLAIVAAYVEQLGLELLDEAHIFRNRSGRPYSKDTLGDDFRDVRAALFGPDERRRLGHDFRRSGAVEAIVGDATPAALSHAMGNTLSVSNTLFRTYVPVRAETIRSVRDARLKGRGKLR